MTNLIIWSEAGAAYPAIMNAIQDAIGRPIFAGDFAGPATAERIWRALRR